MKENKKAIKQLTVQAIERLPVREVQRKSEFYLREKDNFRVSEECYICLDMIKKAIKKPDAEQCEIITYVARRVYHEENSRCHTEGIHLGNIAMFLAMEVSKDPVLIKVICGCHSSQVLDALFDDEAGTLWYGVNQREYLEMFLDYYACREVDYSVHGLHDSVKYARIQFILEAAKKYNLSSLDDTIHYLQAGPDIFGITTKKELNEWIYIIYEFMYNHDIVFTTKASDALEIFNSSIKDGNKNKRLD